MKEKPQEIMKKLSEGEETLALHLKAEGIAFEREIMFYAGRRWRFDFVLNEKIAIEVEGGVWNNGRHNRGGGFIADCEKYNHAVMLGWRVLRFTTEQVKSGHAINFIKEFLGVKK